MTNHEKYFLAPFQACEMQIIWAYKDPDHDEQTGFIIKRYDIETMDASEEIAFVEAEYEDPAALLRWMESEAE